MPLVREVVARVQVQPKDFAHLASLHSELFNRHSLIRRHFFFAELSRNGGFATDVVAFADTRKLTRPRGLKRRPGHS